MIGKIWSKKIPVLFEMHKEDVADISIPLPLLIELSWNHYIGFYYKQIIQFFSTFLPFPFREEQIWLEIKQTKIRLSSTQIVSHIVSFHQPELNKLLCFTCHFRDRNINQSIDLEKHYKNNLKSSTALRYGKQGAKMLTVDMSFNNVKNMYNSFLENNLEAFLGSDNYQSENIGYGFLTHKSQTTPIRIVGRQFFIERKCDQNLTLDNFLKQLLKLNEENNEINVYQQFRLYLHGIRITNGNMSMKSLQKYCHPDGYLYFTHD